MASILNIFERKDTNRIIDIPTEQIVPSRYQPRLVFDDEALQELATSIKENGLIQPITVRKIDDVYEIITGERRFRACKLIGFHTVPCYVMSPNENQAAQMALVENIQRENLTAIEEAKSYLQIMRQSGLTQEQVAQKVGKSQSAVANKIRLLNLPIEIQDAVMEAKITERHARALLTVPSDQQKEVFYHVVAAEFNVRQTEDFIASLNIPKKTKVRHKTKGFSRNTQIAVNTINQSIKMIEKMGITAKVETEDNPQEVRMIIRFPKNS